MVTRIASATRINIELICSRDVSMEGSRVELGQNMNQIDTRIDAIADGHIDEAILTPNMNGRFGSIGCEWG